LAEVTFVSLQCTRLTDRQTDGETSQYSGCSVIKIDWDYTQNRRQLWKSTYLIRLSAGFTDQMSPFISSQYMELQ